MTAYIVSQMNIDGNPGPRIYHLELGIWQKL